MPSEPETLEAEVAEELGQALEVAAPQPVNLFRTEDPVEVIKKATAVATALAQVIEAKNLFKQIGKKKHVFVEGWTLCGTMLGVFPVCEWTRKVEDGWEARVEARTLTGAVVGAAEAECLRSEARWSKADDYAVRSMAQTRATSKALRMPLGFVVTLGGFEATPAEEMGAETQAEEQRKEGGLGDFPTPKTWAKVKEWYERNGGEGAWPLAEAFIRAASYHLYGETDSKKLTADQRKVVLQKAAGATVYLAEDETQPLGPTPSVPLYQKAWAHVLDGAVLEVPDAPKSEAEKQDADAEISDIPFGEEV